MSFLALELSFLFIVIGAGIILAIAVEASTVRWTRSWNHWLSVMAATCLFARIYIIWNICTTPYENILSKDFDACFNTWYLWGGIILLSSASILAGFHIFHCKRAKKTWILIPRVIVLFVWIYLSTRTMQLPFIAIKNIRHPPKPKVKVSIGSLKQDENIQQTASAYPKRLRLLGPLS